MPYLQFSPYLHRRAHRTKPRGDHLRSDLQPLCKERKNKMRMNYLYLKISPIDIIHSKCSYNRSEIKKLFLCHMALIDKVNCISRFIIKTAWVSIRLQKEKKTRNFLKNNNSSYSCIYEYTCMNTGWPKALHTGWHHCHFLISDCEA